MRKVVLFMSVSLDGFIEGPERQIDWHRLNEEMERHIDDQLRTMGAFLSGRVCHELMAAVWPAAGADPASTPRMIEFSRIWLEMPKIVFSRTLERADHNTTIKRDVVVDEIMALKAQPGGDLTLSGADLAASFMRHDLDRRVPHLHPHGAHRAGQAPVLGERDDQPPAHREPDLRQRGCLPALRAGPCLPAGLIAKAELFLVLSGFLEVTKDGGGRPRSGSDVSPSPLRRREVGEEDSASTARRGSGAPCGPLPRCARRARRESRRPGAPRSGAQRSATSPPSPATSAR